MADEQSPLIVTHSRQPPLFRRQRRHRRVANNVCGRFVKISVVCTCLFVFFSAFYHGILALATRHRYRVDFGKDSGLSYDELKDILLEMPSANKAEDWSRYYTSGPHLAGKNHTQAVWTQEMWNEWGVESDIVAYDVYLNYPRSHSLSMLKTSEDKTKEWKVQYKASLKEDRLPDDPTSELKDSVPTFHGYSASGNVTAPFVWVNYGTYQDYEDLIKANITLDGKICVARYGYIFRGLKVKRAQELGMVGCILYSDPGDDGDITEEAGLKAYPEGPARNPSSVQRGSVDFLSQGAGDPTTPGYPSKPGVPRQPVDKVTPSIPSIPISYADAIPILQALNGYGPKASDFGEEWTSNLGLGYKGVDYNIGPSPDSLVLNLFNDQEYVTTPLWNVIGVINGTIPHDVVVVGNHRDAWIAGGAADPNSGSAVMNEVVRAMGEAVSRGWKPLRTIVFASWDGEEYNLIGSTEWVEEYIPWLSKSSVAYVNVDVGVKGSAFRASAAPLMHKILRDVTAMVPSANQTVAGQTVGDLWDGVITTIGSGSDFTAFQDFAGIPSIDFGFGGDGLGDPVYHYHSNYDSFAWMQKYGDPGFKYHEAMAKVLGLTVAELAQKVVIPFNATEYATALISYLERVEPKFGRKENPDQLSTEEKQLLRASPSFDDLFPAEPTGNKAHFMSSLVKLHDALDELYSRAVEFDTRAAWATETLEKGLPWWRLISMWKLVVAIFKSNMGYKFLERQFLYAEGLDGRDWFKHVVFAPGKWTGYAGAVYPGLSENIGVHDWENALKWALIIKDRVEAATKALPT